MKKRVCCMLFTLVLLFGACFVCSAAKQFVPPEFDTSAVAGEHGIAVGQYGYSELPPPENNSKYRIGVCGEIHVKEGKADVWFTNLAENDAWVKLRVLNEKGKIIGETGLLKPGEYVQAVTFYEPPVKGDKITLRVMGYEPDTYYSLGEFSLNTVIKTSDAVKNSGSVWIVLLVILPVIFVLAAVVCVVLLFRMPPSSAKKGKSENKKRYAPKR